MQVVAEPADGRSAATTTDANGNFTLVRLQPGEYHVSGVRNGYLETYYGARRPGSKGTALTLAPGVDSKDLQLRLLPFAVVAGTVRDPEGEPLADARVALIAVKYQNGVRRAQATGQYASTDDLGQYRIPNVAPGRYYVRSGPPEIFQRDDSVDHSPKEARPPEVLVPTFHPVVRDVDGARAIEIAAGDRFTGADVTLLRSRLYRVRVSFDAPEGLSSGVSLNSRPDLSDGLGLRPAGDCKPGVCEFAAVPPGRYLATGSAGPGKMTLDDLFSHSTQTYATALVDVTNADVDGVRLVISAGAEIAGHITVAEGDSAAKQFHVGFVDADGADHAARSSEDGSFTARLSPGHYEVQVFPGGDLVAKSIRSEDTDVMQDGLTVSHAGKLGLEITLSHDAATIGGVVKDKEDKPIPGATVVLIPDAKRRAQHGLYQQAGADQFGRYRFASAAPGDYQLFVWADVEDGIWFDPDFLRDIESEGHAITLAAKDRQSVDLKLPSGGH